MAWEGLGGPGSGQRAEREMTQGQASARQGPQPARLQNQEFDQELRQGPSSGCDIPVSPEACRPPQQAAAEADACGGLRPCGGRHAPVPPTCRQLMVSMVPWQECVGAGPGAKPQTWGQRVQLRSLSWYSTVPASGPFLREQQGPLSKDRDRLGAPRRAGPSARPDRPIAWAGLQASGETVTWWWRVSPSWERGKTEGGDPW